jgi:isoleucyl-tRNA synthetase
MDKYDIAYALSEILPFLDDASNWYVRRSRRRFWKSGDDADKQDAYRTLHYVLVRVSQLLAPFTPFLAEELYQKLTGGESVHLTDWPVPGAIDEQLLSDMAAVRELITDGLAQRAKAGLKVRQPLAKAVLGMPQLPADQAFYQAVVQEELNVKQAAFEQSTQHSVTLDTALTEDLRMEGLSRELIRHIQSARKAAGLQVDDRIDLSIQTDSESLQKALEAHRATILAEVLATDRPAPENATAQTVKVEGAAVTIHLAKAT